MIVYHSSELLSRPAPPIKWLVEGLFPSGTLGDLSGPPGDGKSTILLSLMEHISTGRSWFGRGVAKTPVAWITGEASGSDATHRDLHRLKAAPDTDILFIQPNCEIFRFNSRDGVWTTTTKGAEVFQRCHRAGVGFYVFDTLGSVSTGLVEINNDQQRQLARHLRAELNGSSCISVSHTNQSSAHEDLSRRLHYMSRAGGNGFPGAVRWAAGVTALQSQDSGNLGGRLSEVEIGSARLVAFGVSKHNEMPRPFPNNNSPMIFEIASDGELKLVADSESVALCQRQGKANKRKSYPITKKSSLEDGVDKNDF